MSIWFFISVSGVIAAVPIHFLSVEHLKLREKYGREKGTRIAETCGVISAYLFFLSWIGIWISPQPRFIVQILQDLSVLIPIINLSIPVFHLIISIPFLMLGAWFLVRGVKELSVRVSTMHGPDKVVPTGVYTTVRHPQHLGYLLAHVGMSFLLSTWYSLLSTPLMIALVYLISRKEEEELVREFGKEYSDYKKIVPMLIPFVKKSQLGRIADIDEMMYSCGLEILHPGGIEKTDEMAKLCKIGKNKKVLDIGSGKGVTALYLAQTYECQVIGVDLSERMVEYAEEMARKKGLGGRVSFRRVDVHDLPFDDETFDIVLAECTTVLLDKEKAFTEFLRVTRPGGYIGDLEMTWQKQPPTEVVERVYDVWEGFRTMTLAEWSEFYERMGMAEILSVDFSDTIPNMENAMKKEIGLKGMLRMGWRLLLRSDLRKAMNENRRIFEEYNEYIGYGYMVGRKNQ